MPAESIQKVIHTLGIVFPVLTAGACAVSSLREAHGVRAARRRARALLAAEESCGLRRSVPERWRKRWAEVTREWAGAAAVAAVVTILVGGAAGLVLGLAVAYGAGRWQRRTRDRAARRTAEAGLRAALAPAADLLAACLAAGAGPRESTEAVGRSFGGAVGERLRHVAAELRLGGEPAVSWRRFGSLPGAQGLARCMERAGISGVPAVDGVSRIAAGLRAESARSAAERAHRAGVLVTLPLAACFLPAFLVLGVIPVLIGLAQGLMAHN
ncbi:type II secretion system F family protein [Streptomyces sp. NPDC017056]|uniref:type II secretion system F family protein n=1 Tax=Streptomyces sp. NPDC017056 TaxID=3364973 RepID=UPI003793E60D